MGRCCTLCWDSWKEERGIPSPAIIPVMGNPSQHLESYGIASWGVLFTRKFPNFGKFPSRGVHVALQTQEGHTFPETSWKKGNEGENSRCWSTGSAWIQHRPRKTPRKRWICFAWNQQLHSAIPKILDVDALRHGNGTRLSRICQRGIFLCFQSCQSLGSPGSSLSGMSVPESQGILQEEKGLEVGSGVGERQSREGNV